MKLCHRLHEQFYERSRQVRVEMLVAGLGYTAVALDDGGVGLAYTFFKDKGSCTLHKDYTDWEGRAAAGLLEKLTRADPLQRSLALALVNALNHSAALDLPEDPDNRALFEGFNIGFDTRVAMVGMFRPLIGRLEAAGARLEIIDDFRAPGNPNDFYRKLQHWADVLVLTATSILNDTSEEILSHAGANVRTVMIGPSTPMVSEAFDHLPVQLLAGMVPVDRERVLKLVRHGAGTPLLQKHCRKVYLQCRT